MLGNNRGKLLNQYVPNYVLYDLETTGISCNYDEVIEISALKVRDGRIVDEFDELVNPMRPIPYAASAVNHITDEMVACAPVFSVVLEEFLDFIGDDVLVGHNINSFDMKFLYRDCERYFAQTLTNDFVDTLKFARLCLSGRKHYRLEDLAEVYGIPTEGAHRALNDCKMNQQVFERLAKEKTSMPATNEKEILCPECGQPLKKRSGRYGDFWGAVDSRVADIRETCRKKLQSMCFMFIIISDE